MSDYTLEVVLSPLLFPAKRTTQNTAVVVVDILRATTTICAALYHGVSGIIPVASLEEAYSYKQKGYLLAGERLEMTLGCADFGNSALEFVNQPLHGKTIVHTTTNGTQAIDMALQSGAEEVLIGAFANFSILTDYLQRCGRNIVLFCSGWKGNFCMEDTLFCGAVAEKVLAGTAYGCRNDATWAAMELWTQAKGNPLQYLEKSEHIHRLRKYHYDDVFDFTFQQDNCPVIPHVVDGIIRPLSTL